MYISIIQLIVNEHDLKKAFCISVCAALHGRALYNHTMLLNLRPMDACSFDNKLDYSAIFIQTAYNLSPLIIQKNGDEFRNLHLISMAMIHVHKVGRR